MAGFLDEFDFSWYETAARKYADNWDATFGPNSAAARAKKRFEEIEQGKMVRRNYVVGKVCRSLTDSLCSWHRVKHEDRDVAAPLLEQILGVSVAILKDMNVIRATTYIDEPPTMRGSSIQVVHSIRKQHQRVFLAGSENELAGKMHPNGRLPPLSEYPDDVRRMKTELIGAVRARVNGKNDYVARVDKEGPFSVTSADPVKMKDLRATVKTISFPLLMLMDDLESSLG